MDRPRGRSSLIIPSGGAGLTGWANFRDTLSRIYAAEAQLSGQPAVPIVPDSAVDVSRPYNNINTIHMSAWDELSIEVCVFRYLLAGTNELSDPVLHLLLSSLLRMDLKSSV